MIVDPQKLKKESLFAGRGTVDELLSGLDQVALREKKGRARVVFIRWAALGVFLVGAAAAIDLGGFSLALGMVLAIALLIYSGVVAHAQIVHDRVELVRLMLTTLSQDSGQRGRFSVLLRLRKKLKKLSETAHPHVKGGRQVLLRDPWLSMNGRLKDGTSLSASCGDLIRQRIKKNARGKTKTKERRRCLLRVQLNYNRDRYGDAAIVAQKLQNPFRLPAGVNLKAFNSTADALSVKTVATGNLDAAGLHAAHEAMLLGCYRILHLARKGVAK